MSKKSVQLMLFMLVILAFTFSGGVQAGEIVYRMTFAKMSSTKRCLSKQPTMSS
jgi:hypothetical protein